MRKRLVFASDSWVVYHLPKHSGNFSGNVSNKTLWLDRPETLQSDNYKLENRERNVKRGPRERSVLLRTSSVNEVLREDNS